ncbi:MAG TPA: archease [Euzebyales bacterium]|nr:archease [Euzebyales bacterium]
MPHTADVIVEAWGPTRDACLRHAVLGLVATFADVGDVTASASVPRSFPADSGENLLVALLEEVLYLLDAEDRVPVDVAVTAAADGGLHGEFHVASAAAVDQRGAVPKAITHHGMELRRNAGAWRCRVTVDV